MKKGQNIYKSQKLIRVTLEYDEIDNIISTITISGDFFLYPEEMLETLEASLVGKKLEKHSVKEEIDKCLANSVVYGFDSISLTKAILGCNSVANGHGKF